MRQVWRRWQPRYCHLVVITVVALCVSIAVQAQDFSAITSALGDANAEVRGSVFPAVASILGAIVLIAVAAGVVNVITRNK